MEPARSGGVARARRTAARAVAARGSAELRLRRSWYELNGTPRLEEATYQRIKRAIDLVISLALLPIVVPIVAICMLAIRLDTPGPALLVQERTGKGGRRFRMFKLRTMVQNAHELKALYLHLNEQTYPDFKITNDPRITRCGRLLRKGSLDELPQIFNVIRGEMSLVGPRPTSFKAETYHLWHTARLAPKPGLTGLWQVCGRSEVGFDDRVRLDIAYIRNRCLTLDLQILVRTLGAVLTRRGAS